jgi:localization factor PodJL
MRAELPWNVAGIPPEAREAARAAARREGLSVGEWLTRRILRSFSELGEPMAFEQSSIERPQLDSWGLPTSAASRRETQDMLARVSRSEAEASESYRRIEDQLRNVARRLDNAERGQSESNRAMSKATSEINIASREQAQAFDQLGSHVMGLSERLERMERHTGQVGLRDAVKGLHQGLSRLADQIGQTASQSATQISTLASNLEQLAAHLGQARSDAEIATRALEERVAAVEGAAQRNTNALAEGQEKFDQLREGIENQANGRARDLTELQKWEASQLGSLDRIEERIAQLETKGPDPSIERRLDTVEHALSGMVSRLEQSDPSAALAETLRQVNQRLDAVENRHREMLAELHGSLGQAPEVTTAGAMPGFEPAPETPPFAPPPGFEPVSPDAPLFEEPEFEASEFEASEHEISEQETSVHDAPKFEEPDSEAPSFESEELLFPEEPAFEEHQEPEPEAQAASDAEQSDETGQDQAESEPGTVENSEADALGETLDTETDIAGTDFTAAPAEPAPAAENFLSAARRSARAAAEAEAHRGPRGFSWNHPGTGNDEKSSPRYLAILVAAFVGLLAIAIGMMWSHRQAGSESQAVNRAVTPRTVTPEAKSAQPRVLPPQIAPSSSAPSKSAPPKSATANPAPATMAPSSAVQPKAAEPAAGPATGSNSPQQTANVRPPSVDKIAAAAEAGNPIAETIIGLRYLDGQGIAPDPSQALKWLQKAANAGQAVAQYRLGTMYERGQGVAASPATAAKWYLAAANQGNRKAMHNLAVTYAEGINGKKDMAESARWFAKAADLGLSDSQFNLAVLYERGDGVPQSLIDAYKWYAVAAAQGDAESRSRMTVLATQLSPEDRAAASRAAEAFHAQPLNRGANVAPEPQDLVTK